MYTVAITLHFLSHTFKLKYDFVDYKLKCITFSYIQDC